MLHARTRVSSEEDELGLAERKMSRLGKDLDVDGLYDQLDTLRAYVEDLSRSAGKGASQGYGRAHDLAADAAHDAEQTMKDNLAASLAIAVGLGVLVGYFLGHGTK